MQMSVQNSKPHLKNNNKKLTIDNFDVNIKVFIFLHLNSALRAFLNIDAFKHNIISSNCFCNTLCSISSVFFIIYSKNKTLERIFLLLIYV